jgi:hypothetical protein
MNGEMYWMIVIKIETLMQSCIQRRTKAKMKEVAAPFWLIVVSIHKTMHKVDHISE